MICLFFMINSSVLLNVFYIVNLEIWAFYKYFNLQVSSVFINSNCCYTPIVILHFFEATWLMSQPSSCLNFWRFPLSKWLKSRLFLLTERRGPSCILSQTVVILDGRSVIFSTFYACVIEKTFYWIPRVNFVRVSNFSEQ